MLVKILHSAANFKFDNGNYEESSKYFLQLIKLDNANCSLYIPKLVISLSKFDPSAAAKYADSIPDISFSNEEIDIEKLENISAHRSNNRDSKQDIESNTDKVVERKKKKKKKKKKRLPKNYNPNVAPDPERWLPRNQRSTFKKRKNKMKGRHQGQDSGEKETKQETKEETPKPTPAKPQQTKKQKKQKGKKKKGGRR